MIYQTRKKCMAVLLVLVMMLTAVPMIALATSDPPFAGGDGSQDHPYEIANQDQLDSVRDYLGSYFMQTANITINTITYPNWAPIGTVASPFTGSYDGGDYWIRDLKINTTASSDSHTVLGLFGVVGHGGLIGNINLENVDIDVASGSSTSVESFIGGLVGANLGTISNCSVTGTLDAASQQIAAGGLAGNIGGFNPLGYDPGVITGCTSNCTLDITGNYQVAHAGGLVGEALTPGSSINNSNSSGIVTCRGGSDVNQTGPTAGGLLGYADDIEIENCSSDSVVSALNARSQANAGGLIGGIAGNCTISNCTSTGNATVSDASGSTPSQISAGGLIGSSFSASVIANCHSSGDAIATGTGASSWPSLYVYSGGFLGYASAGGGGVNISQCYALGNSTTTVNINGYAFAGGFGGYLGNTNVSKSYSKGNAQAVSAAGYAGAGGFTGYFFGVNTLANCFSTGNAVANCANNERAGGFSGVVQNSAVSYCYSAGIPSVSHDAYLPKCGGLTGVNNAGTISNCYYDSTVSGKTDTDRGTPMSTSDMQKPDFVTYMANAGAGWKLVSNLNGGYLVIDGVGLGALPTSFVTYKDGTDESTMYGSDIVAQGIVFSQPSWISPSKADSSLTGWYTDPSCASSFKWNFATQTVSSGAHMLYAGWEALDPTAPTLTVGAVNRLSDTSATSSFISDEAGAYYYVVVENDAGEPVIDISGAGTACTTGETVISLTTLIAGEKDIYIKVKDAAGNVSAALKIDIPAYAILDTVEPTLTAGAVNRLSDTNATVTFTSDEAGDYYYVVVEDGDGEPVIDTSGAGTACTTGETVISLTTLIAGAKDIYIKVKDAAGNVSAALELDIPIFFVPVTGILDVPASAAAGTDLVLTGTVTPADATNQSIVWSVKSAGATGANIAGNILSTTGAGTVIVTAAIVSGVSQATDYTQDFTVIVYSMAHDILEEQVDTTVITAEGLFAEVARLIVVPIADGDADRVELEEQLSEQNAIAAYEIHVEPAGAFQPPLTLTFRVGQSFNGRTVYILHKLSNGSTDIYTPTVENGEAVITVNELSPFLLADDPQVTIVQQPQSALALVGQTAAFHVEATGLDPLSYQWQRRTGDGAAWEDISGAASTGYTTTKVNMSHNGYQYRVIVTDVLGNSATSDTAILTVAVSPATGDNSKPLVYAVMTVLFAAAMIFILRKRRMA